MRFPLLSALAVAACHLLAPTLGLRYSWKGATVGNPLALLIDPFGVLVGARVSLNLTATRPPSQRTSSNVTTTFLLCTEREATSLEIDPLDVNSCRPESLLCSFKVVSADLPSSPGAGVIATGQAPLEIQRNSLYYALLADCPATLVASAPYRLDGELSFVNPGGEQLPTGKMPLPAVFSCLAVLWPVVLAWHLLQLMCIRPSSVSRATRLQWSLCAWPPVKCASAVASALWWRHVSRLGTTPNSGSLLFWEYWVSSILAEVIFFSLMVMLSSGYGVVRRRVDPDAWWMSLLLLMLAGSSFAEVFWSRTSIQVILWLAHVLLRVSVVVYAFALVSKNVRELEAHAAMEGAGIAPPEPGSHTYVFTMRRKIMMSFKQLLTLWLVLSLGVYFALLVFESYLVWVTDTLYESLALFFFVCLTFVFQVHPVPVTALERDADDRPIHNPGLRQRVLQWRQRRQEQ